MDLSNKRRYSCVFAELALANDVLERSSEVFREHAIDDRILSWTIGSNKISVRAFETRKINSLCKKEFKESHTKAEFI